MWGEALQALGEAAEGGLAGYSWAKKFQQDERALEQKVEIARLNNEIKALLESMKESGRMERHATVSGNVTAQQEGADRRTDATNETRRTIAEMQADVQRNNESGRNRRFESGVTARGLWQEMQDRTRRRGQDLQRETATERDETTRRGQDFGLGTAVMRDGTTRRGQDAATERARMRPGAGGGLPPVDAEAPDAPPAAPAAPGPDRAALAQQLRAAIDAVKNAKTPEERAKARQDLARIRAQVK